MKRSDRMAGAYWMSKDMNAKELADKFADRVAAAAAEKDKQDVLAAENIGKRTDDVDHCKRAMAEHVLPFFAELKHHMGEQFSYAHQIDIHDHKPVGVSFQVGDGGPVSITTVFGNIIVTRLGSSGASKGMAIVYPPDAEPHISNSGDLTRDKMAKLVEMVIDNTGR
jgi:hypothetical protein